MDGVELKTLLLLVMGAVRAELKCGGFSEN